MSPRNVTHASFSIERVYPARPERVFRAFSDIESKAAWYEILDDLPRFPGFPIQSESDG